MNTVRKQLRVRVEVSCSRWERPGIGIAEGAAIVVGIAGVSDRVAIDQGINQRCESDSCIGSGKVIAC
jgi:hypothetical protein